MGWFNFGSSPQPPPPAAPGAKPAPPPTTPNASATGPTQDCPLHAKHPCDVNKLSIQVDALEPKGGPHPTISLETTKVRRFEPVTDVRDSTVLSLLKQYDLLIDCTANAQAITNAKAKPAQVGGSATYTSPDCATQSHPLLSLMPLGKHEDIIKKEIGASSITMPQQPFYARTSYIDDINKRKELLDNVVSVLFIVESFMETVFGFITEVDLRADGCGMRAADDKTPPNKTLLARVRIFRTSKWAIGLKIPALGKYKEERAANTNIQGVAQTSQSTSGSAAFNAVKGSSSSTTSGEGVLANTKTSSQTQLLGSVDSTETSRKVSGGSVTEATTVKASDADGYKISNKDGVITLDEIKERLANESGFDLIISMDDQPIDILDGIKKIKELLKKISDTIKDVKKLLDSLPQVGWKFTFDITILAGSLIVQYAPEYLPGLRANGRYSAVQHRLSVQVEMQIFDLSLELSFGLDAQALGTGLVLKVAGKLGLKCKISREVTLDFFNPISVWNIIPELEGKLSVVGYVSAAGYTLANAELSASTGLDFSNGKFTVAFGHPVKFGLTGVLKTKAILVSGYYESWWGQRAIGPLQLLKSYDLVEFK